MQLSQGKKKDWFFSSYLFDGHEKTTVSTIAHWTTVIGCFFLELEKENFKNRT